MIDDAWIVRKLAQIRQRSRNADSSMRGLLPLVPANELDGGVDRRTLPEDSVVEESDS